MAGFVHAHQPLRGSPAAAQITPNKFAVQGAHDALVQLSGTCGRSPYRMPGKVNHAGRAEQQEIGAFFEAAIACGQRHHLRLADHGDGCEVEAGKRLATGNRASAR